MDDSQGMPEPHLHSTDDLNIDQSKADEIRDNLHKGQIELLVSKKKIIVELEVNDETQADKLLEMMFSKSVEQSTNYDPTYPQFQSMHWNSRVVTEDEYQFLMKMRAEAGELNSPIDYSVNIPEGRENVGG